MKLPLLFVILSFVVQEELPFKANEDFEVKLQYEFRQRPINDDVTIRPSETVHERNRRTSTGVLPYLGIHLKMIKLQPEEVRLRIQNNQGKQVLTRKVKDGDIASFNMGFTDDMKDRVTAHEYTASFMSEDRKELSRIVITVDKDGTFLVNNEKRGKF